MEFIRLASVDSTNSRLKAHHPDYRHLTVLSADRQTAGRGRLGRAWFDDGKAALFSILLKENLDVATIDRIPLLAAVALHKKLSSYAQKLKIKWPNDIVSDEGKIAGILCESVIENGVVQAFVVGFGVNVNTVTFPDALAASASSLFLESGRVAPVAAVIETTAAAFAAELQAFLAGSMAYVAYCNKHSSLKGERIFFLQNGVRMDGVAGKMLPDGALSVRTATGIVLLHSGEATISGGMKIPSE